MRVIAGSAGGIRLAVPRHGVRPTMDRVKAAIFSSLGDVVIGARVLDLFAGSGALGIEALSRGAASAVFVDADRRSVEVIERNLARTNLPGSVRQQDVFDFLSNVTPGERFQIIFADPPYEKTRRGAGYPEKLLSNELLPRWLAPGGVFILEKPPRTALPKTDRWRVDRRKTYGATEVLFLSAAG